MKVWVLDVLTHWNLLWVASLECTQRAEIIAVTEHAVGGLYLRCRFLKQKHVLPGNVKL